MSAAVTMASDLPVLPVAAAAAPADPATASAFAQVLGGALDGAPAGAQASGANPTADPTSGPAAPTGLWGSAPGATGSAADLPATGETPDADAAGQTAGATAGDSRPARTRPAAEDKPADAAASADELSATEIPLAVPLTGLLPVTPPTGSAPAGAAAKPETRALDGIGGPLGGSPVPAGPALGQPAAPAPGSSAPSAPSATGAAATSDGPGSAGPDKTTTAASAAPTSTPDRSAAQADAASALPNALAGRPDAPGTPIHPSVPGARPQSTARSFADEATGTPGLAAAPSLAAPTSAPAVAAVSEPAATGHLAAAQPELADALARLRHKGDGTSELTVSLHPAELGSVGVTATMRGGTLTVTVACADPAAHAAVTAALPTLRNDLASAGFTGIDVAVGDGGRQQDPRDSAPGSGPGPQPDQEPADVPLRRPSTTVRSSTDRGVDRWL